MVSVLQMRCPLTTSELPAPGCASQPLPIHFSIFGENYVVTPPIVFARAFLPPFALPDAQSRNFPNHVGLFLQSHE